MDSVDLMIIERVANIDSATVHQNKTRILKIGRIQNQRCRFVITASSLNG